MTDREDRQDRKAFFRELNRLGLTGVTDPHLELTSMADILLITGLSGAGRSGAAAVLEDVGWYVIDNLPTELVDTIVELVSKPGSGIDRLALVAGRQLVAVIRIVIAVAVEVDVVEQDPEDLALDREPPSLIFVGVSVSSQASPEGCNSQ